MRHLTHLRPSPPLGGLVLVLTILILSSPPAHAAPEISIPGPMVSLESTLAFSPLQGTTHHSLTLPAPALGGGTISVTAVGGFEQFGPTVTAEGKLLGALSGMTPCVPGSKAFTLNAADFGTLAQDGVIMVDVKNPFGVLSSCTESLHTVKITYRSELDAIDFGQVPVHSTAFQALTIENTGTSSLEISSISADTPEYTTSASSLTVAAGATASIVVYFSPGAAGAIPGTLSLESDDPARPVVSIDLSGSGVDAPSIAVQPPAISFALPTGYAGDKTLEVSNLGSATLHFTTSVQTVVGSTPIGSLAFSPTSGSLAPGESVTVNLHVDVYGTGIGMYRSNISFDSNDPAHPSFVVPVTLAVTAPAEMHLPAETIVRRSSEDYILGHSPVTSHELSLDPPPSGPAELTLEVQGDFYSKTAALVIEGQPFGYAGNHHTACGTPESLTVTLSPQDLATFGADGVLGVDVVNDPSVDETACFYANHTVVLTYPVSQAHIDFGTTSIGGESERSLQIENTGAGTLYIDNVVVSGSGFSSPVNGLEVPPGSTENLPIRFAPAGEGPSSGMLSFGSSDPARPSASVVLSGSGEEAPAASVEPAGIDAALSTDQTAVRHLTLRNDGPTPLDYAVSIRTFPEPGGTVDPPAGPRGRIPTRRDAESAAGSTGASEIPVAPVPLRCLVAEPGENRIYGLQAGTSTTSARGFYRFDTVHNRWDRLDDAPLALHGSDPCVEVFLGGRIYALVAGNADVMMVYDVAASAWSTRPHPLGRATTAMTGDGSRFLYVGSGATFARYDLVTSELEVLPTPPGIIRPFKASFDYLEGIVYGNDYLQWFAAFDTHTRSWTPLPDPPAQSHTPGAISPGTGEYYTQSYYWDSYLYRFTFATSSWDVIDFPPARGNEYTPVFSSGSRPGIYLLGTGASTGPSVLPLPASGFAGTDVPRGSVPPFGSVDIPVSIEARRLLEGRYESRIRIATNDPANALIEIPLVLDVSGAPEMHAEVGPVELESALQSPLSLPQTVHHFALPAPARQGGQIQLTVDGLRPTFGALLPIARLWLDGTYIGHVSAIDPYSACQPVTAVFQLDPQLILDLSTKQSIEATVIESYDNPVACPFRQHDLRLTYPLDPALLEFGETDTGETKTLPVNLTNYGTGPLTISSISTSDPAYTASPASAVVPAQTSLRLDVQFAPQTFGVHEGTLRIDSDDPVSPSLSLDITGPARGFPALSVQPSAVEETLPEGGSGEVDLQVRNVGTGPGSISARLRQTGSLVWGNPVTVDSVESLPNSPEPLACLVPDPAEGVIYGLTAYGTGWYRYRTRTEAWETLGNAPLDANGSCSGVFLAGKIYLSTNAFSSSHLELYDVDTGRWSLLGLTSAQARASVASDGWKHIYFSNSTLFSRYDVESGELENLPSPPIPERDGGLRYLDGRIYLHSDVYLASYDTVARTWTILPDAPINRPHPYPPPGVGPGSAMTPVSRAYYTQGLGAGPVFRYDIARSEWSQLNNPFFSPCGGGSAWLSKPIAAVYMSQGPCLGQGSHTAFVRLHTGEIPAEVAADAFELQPGAETNISIRLEAGPFPPGDYPLTLDLFSSSDDAQSEDLLLSVPINLEILPAPKISLRAGPFHEEQLRDFFGTGASTHFRFPTPDATGPALLDVAAKGDLDTPNGIALSVEGHPIKNIIEGFPACAIRLSETHALSEALFSELASDGQVEVLFQNSAHVNDLCPMNFHSAGLTWWSDAKRLDFGDVFLDWEPIRRIPLIVENRGSVPLNLLSMVTSSPDFTAPAGPSPLAPNEIRTLDVAFAPTAAGSSSGNLVIETDDPVSPEVVIPLEGSAGNAPRAAVLPTGFLTAVPVSGSQTFHVKLANHGGTALEWDLGLNNRAAGSIQWIDASPRSGTLPPGETSVMDLSLRAQGLGTGDYAATIIVRSNDPFEDAVDMPVAMHVGAVGINMITLDPRTLNLTSRGRFVTLWLQFSKAFDPHDVAVDTVRLNGAVPAAPSPVGFEDSNGDGLLEIVLKVPRALLEKVLEQGLAVPVTVTGEIGAGTWFRGETTVRVIKGRARREFRGRTSLSGD